MTWLVCMPTMVADRLAGMRSGPAKPAGSGPWDGPVYHASRPVWPIPPQPKLPAPRDAQSLQVLSRERSSQFMPAGVRYLGSVRQLAQIGWSSLRQIGFLMDGRMPGIANHIRVTRKNEIHAACCGNEATIMKWSELGTVQQR